MINNPNVEKFQEEFVKLCKKYKVKLRCRVSVSQNYVVVDKGHEHYSSLWNEFFEDE